MKLKAGVFYNDKINSIFTIHSLAKGYPDGPDTIYILTLAEKNYVVATGKSIMDTLGDSVYLGKY
jgi:glycogen synthase